MILDAIIILALLGGAVIGFKKGAIKTVVQFVGLVLSFIIAASLKDTLAGFFYDNLPFFDFNGIFKGVSALNILLYEGIAFFIILAIAIALSQLLNNIAGIIEKILKATIILSIPSKLVGIVVGFIESLIYVFVFIYIISLPILKVDVFNDSKMAGPILNNMPVLSNLMEKPINAIKDIYSLKDKYKNENSQKFNRDAIDILLKYNITRQDTIDKLVKNKKLKI